MHFIRKDAAILIGCLTLALVLMTPAVIHADEWNLGTRFMVSHTSEVPGLILQPDTRYVIRLLDSPSERRVVQIYNDDQSRMLTMFMCAADERTTAVDKTVFTFIETEPGYPMPIKEWFYPGRLSGLEFIYSKQQAQTIAQHALEPILYADAGDLHKLAALTVEATKLPKGELPLATTAANFSKSESSTSIVEEKPSVQESAPIEQNNSESNLNTKTESETQPVQEQEVPREKPVETAAETAPAPEQNNSNNTTETPELPRTAGELPLIALIGALCVGAGFGMRVLSNKS